MQRTQNSQHNWRRKTGLTLLNVKTNYKVRESKLGDIDERKDEKFIIVHWNSIESPEIAPYEYSQLIFDEGAKAIWWSKNCLFNKKCWNSWILTCQKEMYLDSHLTLFTKTNPKWITGLNIPWWKGQCLFCSPLCTQCPAYCSTRILWVDSAYWGATLSHLQWKPNHHISFALVGENESYVIILKVVWNYIILQASTIIIRHILTHS